MTGGHNTQGGGRHHDASVDLRQGNLTRQCDWMESVCAQEPDNQTTRQHRGWPQASPPRPASCPNLIPPATLPLPRGIASRQPDNQTARPAGAAAVQGGGGPLQSVPIITCHTSHAPSSSPGAAASSFQRVDAIPTCATPPRALVPLTWRARAIAGVIDGRPPREHFGVIVG